jgi:predicted HicB family RNase H-like nuclease
VGHVLNVRDVIAFDGRTVDELEQAFHAVVDEYIEDYRRIGKQPERPFSGRFNVRMTPEQHSRLARVAASQGKSLNAWVVEQLERVSSRS